MLICFRHYFKSVRPIRKKFSCIYLTKLCRDETSVRIVDPQTKVRLHCFPRVWQFEGHSKNHMYVQYIYIHIFRSYIAYCIAWQIYCFADLCFEPLVLLCFEAILRFSQLHYATIESVLFLTSEDGMGAGRGLLSHSFNVFAFGRVASWDFWRLQVSYYCQWTAHFKWQCSHLSEPNDPLNCWK